MKVNNLIAKLNGLDIQLRLEKGQIKINAPEKALNDDLISEIKDLKSELVEHLKKENINAIDYINASEKKEYYNQSSGQKRMFYLSQLEEVGESYNIPTIFSLKGDFEMQKAERAIRQIINRHEMLRTSFDYINNTLVQVIKDDVFFKINVVDKSLETDIDPVDCFNKYTESYNINKLPLFKILIIKIAKDEHLFIYDLHHILADGISLQILFRDFIKYYLHEDVKPIRIQYRDYTIWRDSEKKQDSLLDQEKFWLNNLSGEIPVLNLPYDYKRHENFTFQGETFITSIEGDLFLDFKRICRDQRVTSFMTYLAVLNVVFRKYSNQDDIIIGNSHFGRTNKDLQDLMGMFVNNLAIRNKVDAELSFSSFIQEVKKNSLQALSNNEYPFEEIVNKLNIEKDTSINPIFNVCISFQNFDFTENQIEGLTVKPIFYENKTAKFDIAIIIVEESDKLSIRFEFCNTLFKLDTIKRLDQHLKNALKNVSQSQDSLIKDIEIIDNEEKKGLIRENSFKVGYQSDKTIIDFFDKQVQENPDRIAVIDKESFFTYKEIEKASNQLANYLISDKKVQQEDFIVLLLDKSAATIISILGILKAGGAYIPIDPTQPLSRIQEIIEDTKAEIVISQKKYLNDLNSLQWEEKGFKTYLCIDSENIYEEEERRSDLMDQKLWDYIVDSNDDDIACGGWKSSYTGDSISKEEMDEYSQNVVEKLKPLVNKETRILEIGCATGLTMYKLAPFVSYYHGTDLSAASIEKNKRRIEKEGHSNIKLTYLPAHEIDKINEGEFDLIIMNSVVQHFHGMNYLRDVLVKSIDLLKDSGTIFIGDIMDQDKKTDLIADILDHKIRTNDKSKTEFTEELFLSKGFFEDLKFQFQEVSDILYSEKIRTIENELTKYRYDLLINVDKNSQVSKQGDRVKCQDDMRSVRRYSYGKPEVNIKPQNLAYAIYTSGTTGKPKGVMIEHRNIVQLFFNDEFLFHFSENDIWTMFHSYSFDFSVWEMYGALLFGGKLVIISKDIAKNSELYLEVLKKEKVTVLNQTPSSFFTLANLEAEEEANNLFLKYVVFGGEALYPAKLKAWHTKYPDVQLVNMYGITETTVHVTYKRVSDEDISENISNVGKALPTLGVHILDSNHNLLPIGVPGELCVTGYGLGRGYIGDQQLTNNKFIENPFNSEERMYLSGDLAKKNAKGEIEYLGRIDKQVKIRGFRIELGEIQSRLLKCSNIVDSIVVKKEGTLDDEYLCAYVVAKSKVRETEIKTQLSSLLPDYMIPTSIIQIDYIPLTANGKVDFKQLPEDKLKARVDIKIEPGELADIVNFDESKKENLDSLLQSLVYYSKIFKNNFLKKDVNFSSINSEIIRDNPIDRSEHYKLYDKTEFLKLIETQAKDYPDKIALSDENTTFTNLELLNAINNVSTVLKKKGIENGKKVGVLVENPIESIITIISLQKLKVEFKLFNATDSVDEIKQDIEKNEIEIVVSTNNSILNNSFTELACYYELHDSVYVTETRAPIEDFDSLDIPNRSLIDYDKYNQFIGQAMVKNSIAIQGTRGCPYNCAYCHKIWSKKHVVRSAENIFNEVLLYYKMGVKRFVILDDIFNLNRKNSRKFFELVIEKGLDIQLFFPNGLRGDILTKEYIDLMVKAGTVNIALALETASPRLQKEIGKNLNLEKLKENIEYICTVYPDVLLELFTMIGFPSETKEEAQMTMEFIKGIKWLHFPYVHVLKIYPNTDMEKMAYDKGITKESILKSANLAFHELPDTLPFDKKFVINYQAEFLNQYFLNKERVLKLLPFQMQVLTEDEIVQKYNSYLSVDINTIDDLLSFVGINSDELNNKSCCSEDKYIANNLNDKINKHFKKNKPKQEALKILMIDLSQFYSGESNMLYDVVEPPLGLMYLLTYLERKLDDAIDGKIIKSRIDFNNDYELRAILDEFKPDVIGIRTLSYYKDFFHRILANIRLWGWETPIVSGGPYSTSDNMTVLNDKNLDIVILGEGEESFYELISAIIENDKQLPKKDTLKNIRGISFAKENLENNLTVKEILLVDTILKDKTTYHLLEDSFVNKEISKKQIHSEKILGEKVRFIFNDFEDQFRLALLNGESCFIGKEDEKISKIDFVHDAQKSGYFSVNVEMKNDVKNEEDNSLNAYRNNIERVLYAIWSEILGIDINVLSDNSDFFDLGGHSLKATVLMNRIHKDLNVKVTLANLFKTSTIKEMAEHIDELSISSYSSIDPVEKREYYELSHAQRRLWILSQFEEDSNAYNMPFAYTMAGELDITLLNKAINIWVNKHESLRTAFISFNYEPYQVIKEDLKINLEFIDITSIFNENERKNRAKELFLEEANTPFDLKKLPLFRVKCLKIDLNKYVLILNFHHIINDGWSMGVFSRELINEYNILKKQSQSLDRKLMIQYKDYTSWHNSVCKSDEFVLQRQYWLAKFADKPKGMSLPYDYPKNVVQTFNGQRVISKISNEKKEQINKLCKRNGSTLFMGLVSAISVLLYKYTGQKDIILGSPIAGRRHYQLKDMIGFLVNTLVLRFKLDVEFTFSELLKVINDETVKSFENQDFPFDMLVDGLELERDVSYSPIFNVMVAHNNADTWDLSVQMDGTKRIRDFSYGEDFNMSKFDLTFFIDEVDDYILFKIEYNSDLFKRTTIERMSKNFNELLNSIVDNDTIKVKDIKSLHQDEYTKVTQHFNHTEENWTHQNITSLVEKGILNALGRKAVVFDDNCITYEELNSKANQIAHYLRKKQKVTPNQVIGLCMDRSLEMITAILGIIKSGAAYLALDPTYPKDRIEHMILDSEVEIILINNVETNVLDGFDNRIISLDTDWNEIKEYSIDNPEIVNTAEDNVYVIYTSGSTGVPNGALLTHGLLANLVQWQIEKSPIDNSSKCLQFTSTNFCVSFQEIIVTLSGGGEIHLIDDIERRNVENLLDFICKNEIENLYLPFSYLNFLFTEFEAQELLTTHNLKNIITAGEQLRITNSLELFLKSNENVKLHNHYGSSEMHVVASKTIVGADQKTLNTPVGSPISNTKIFILDEDRHPSPIGVWGEIYVLGSIEVKGYINNEDLSKAKLVYIPELSTENNLYKSGDVGRWLENGEIEVFGRKDDQIKIRGFRIEIGEVESRIHAIEGVVDCVVKVLEDENNEKILAGYVVLEQSIISIEELNQKLATSLPQYMIPRMVLMKELPLMPNGKVDRENLPKLKPKDELETLLPETENEIKMVGLWAEILGVPQESISKESNFFEIGGHSLKATKLVSIIHKQLDIVIPLTEFFKNPILEKMAMLLEQNIEEESVVSEEREVIEF